MNILSEITQITEKEALELLFSENNNNSNDDVFDVFGNYIYPTEYICNSPNSATGNAHYSLEELFTI